MLNLAARIKLLVSTGACGKDEYTRLCCFLWTLFLLASFAALSCPVTISSRWKGLWKRLNPFAALIRSTDPREFVIDSMLRNSWRADTTHRYGFTTSHCSASKCSHALETLQTCSFATWCPILHLKVTFEAPSSCARCGITFTMEIRLSLLEWCIFVQQCRIHMDIGNSKNSMGIKYESNTTQWWKTLSLNHYPVFIQYSLVRPSRGLRDIFLFS